MSRCGRYASPPKLGARRNKRQGSPEIDEPRCANLRYFTREDRFQREHRFGQRNATVRWATIRVVIAGTTIGAAVFLAPTANCPCGR